MDDQAAEPRPDDNPLFAVIAKRMVRFTGSAWAVAATFAVLGLWLAVGFVVDFSRSWELSMIVGLPLVTLLLLIVVQHTQNHDNLAMQLKLDELIRAHGHTQDEMMRVEDASYEHLQRLERHFKVHVEEATERKTSA